MTQLQGVIINIKWNTGFKMSNGEKQVLELKSMSIDALMELFRDSEAPILSEMHGEYEATLLKQKDIITYIACFFLTYNPIFPGRWQCKSFRPVDEIRGRGYNTFKHFGRVAQRFPMLTLVAPSRYDHKPAYQLVYHAFNSYCGDIHMVDEVRRISDNIYLGIGRCGKKQVQQDIPLPFLLKGPVASYRGDIGVERPSFVLESEILMDRWTV